MERYQRQRLLGQGQMSVVWLARDTYTQDLVALKIMLTIAEDDKRNQKAWSRFNREIQIARGLQHPHILPVLDSGYMLHNNRTVPFLVSPYMREGSLAELMRNTPPWKHWSLLQTADAILQAAESLWYLHTRTPHIVHQDVKPGNFLLYSVQSPPRAVHLYLCDFGISRWQPSSSTMASEVLGTFAFMAPEQSEGRVDPASDQYSLAVMACLLLTGKLPLQASTNEQYIHAHLYEPPIPPGQLNAERIQSSEIDNVILRALEKIPERRFPTALKFAQALQQAIIRFVQAKANARTERLDLTLAKTISLDRKSSTPPAPPPHVEVERIPIFIDPVETNEGKVLDEPLPGKPLAVSSIRSEETLFPLLPLQGSGRYNLPARPKMLCWSPDGSCLACVLYGHAPLLVYRDSSVQEVRTSGAVQAVCMCWSPDGRVLAVSSQGEIHFWDTIAHVELSLVLRLNVRAVEGLDWSTRGQLAIWVENQILLYSLSHVALTSQHPLSPSQRLATGTMRCNTIGVLRWSPDGSLLAAGASNGAVLCWSIDSQASPWQVTAAGQKVNGVAWSPDGVLLAVAFRDNRVVGWNTRTKDKVLLWEKLPAMPRTLSISAGQRVAIASSEQRLLCGLSSERFPSAMLPGQLLAAWSPTRPELATLDAQKETTLVVWRE